MSSNIVCAGRPQKMRVRVIPGRGVVAFEGDVYRDGDEVVVVTAGNLEATTPFGPGALSVNGRFMIRFRDEQVFAWAKARAFDKNPALYTKVVGVLQVDDDPQNAPELPDEIRQAFARGAAALPSVQPLEDGAEVITLRGPSSSSSSKKFPPLPPPADPFVKKTA